jgi:uncharacterized protein involved in exopolysaccharide biosynthesis
MDIKPQHTVIDLRQLLWQARADIWVIVLPLTTAFCVAFVFLAVAVPQYSSYGTVAPNDQANVSPGLEPLVHSEEQRGTRAVRIAELDSRIHGRSFLEAVARRLGLHRDPEIVRESILASQARPELSAGDFAARKAAGRIAKRIQVSPVSNAYVRIAAFAEDPRFAQALATAVVDQLIEASRTEKLSELGARSGFSEEQITIYKDNVRKAEEALRRHQESMISRSLQNVPITEATLAAARTVLRGTDEEIAGLRNRILAGRAAWQREVGNDSDPPVLGSSRASSLEGQLEDFEVRLGMALLSGTDPTAAKLRIGTARQSLYEEYQVLAAALPLSSAAREAAAGIAVDRGELRSLGKKRRTVSGYINTFTSTQQSRPREQLELERLQREVEAQRGLLLTLQREASSSQLSEALEVSAAGFHYRIIERPQLPLAPFFPNKNQVLLIALLAGTALGIGLILLVHSGPVLRTVEQAEEALGLRVLATLPRAEGWPAPGSFLRTHWGAVSTAAVIVVTLTFFAVHATLSSERKPGSRARVHGALGR